MNVSQDFKESMAKLHRSVQSLERDNKEMRRELEAVKKELALTQSGAIDRHKSSAMRAIASNDQSKMDILAAKEAGCMGVVIGALTPDFKLPYQLLKTLVDLALPMEVTFHRAFDVVLNPEQSLETLIDLGFQRVLTSGQQEDAVSGLPLLKKLHTISKGKITVMPGGGVQPENCGLFKEAGFEALHFSAFKAYPPMETPSEINANFSFLKQPLGEADAETIRSIVKKIKS